MDSLDYMKFFAASEGKYSLPDFFYDDNDEFDFDRGFEHLTSAGYMLLDENDNITFGKPLEEDYPEVFRLFQDIHKAEIQSTLDEMVSMGMIEASINDDGEMVYGLNADYREFLEGMDK